MTTLNTIIGEEKDRLQTIECLVEDNVLEDFLTAAMQRAYEAGIQKSIEIVEPYWDEAPVQNVVDQLKKEITSDSKKG